jgi:membrane protein YdbS with pleckstrin-like domain
VLHRVLFRQHARRTLVSAGQRFALAGFATLGLAVVGVCALIFDVVLGVVAGAVAAAVAFVVFATLWVVWPMFLRRRVVEEEEEEA